MGLVVGGKQVAAMRAGDREVVRAYLGNKPIWSAESPVFDPLALGWTAAGWAEDPDWVIGDGDPVATWPGHGTDLTASSGAYGPTWVTSGIGGKPAVRFDGANDHLRSTLSISQPDSLVLIARFRTVPGTNMWLTEANQGSGTARQIIGARMGTWQFFAGAWLASAVAVDTDPHLVTAHAGGASSRLLLDGATIATGTTTYHVTNFQLGALGSPPEVDIAFWGVYSGDVTTAPGWAAWQTWALEHYGIAP